MTESSTTTGPPVVLRPPRVPPEPNQSSLSLSSQSEMSDIESVNSLSPCFVTEKSGWIIRKSRPPSPPPSDEPPEKVSTVAHVDTNIVYPTKFRLAMILASLFISNCLVSLDGTIISPAIPQMTDDFHALSDASWYGTAYFLAAAALLPTWGKLFQILNLKLVCMLNMLTFMAGSILCGGAPNSIAFIIGRAITGIAAGGTYAGCMTVLAYSVPLHRRASFNGIFGAIYSISSCVAPLLGGAFTDTATWRWCFYINIPLGAVSVAVFFLFMQQPVLRMKTTRPFEEQTVEIDYIGPALFIPGIVCLLLALKWGGITAPWRSPVIIGLLSAAVILLPLWTYSQYRLGERATIPIHLIMVKTVFFAAIYGFFLFGSLIILTFYLPLYFQAIKGSSAMMSAVYTLPLVITLTISCTVGGMLVSMVGYCTPFMIVGSVIATVGIGLLSTAGVETPFVALLGYQVIVGVGLGVNLTVTYPETMILIIRYQISPSNR